MNILKGLIDLIYPPRCIICEHFLWSNEVITNGIRVSLCQGCIDEFKKIDSPFCSICGRPFEDASYDNHHCQDCLIKPPTFDRLMAPYLFDGKLKDAIYELKYAFKTFVADSLGPLLADFCLGILGGNREFLVMPVPLHTKRLRQRGFNQSLLLARYVADALHAELAYLSLVRIKFTQPQTGLKKKERRKNVSKAFEVKSSDSIKGRNILLVDDVATTGSTLNECARVLKKAGCREVFAVVLARAVI